MALLCARNWRMYQEIQVFLTSWSAPTQRSRLNHILITEYGLRHNTCYIKWSPESYRAYSTCTRGIKRQHRATQINHRITTSMTAWRTSSSSITAPLVKIGCEHDLLAVFRHKVRILWRKINRGEYKSTQQTPPRPTGGEMTCTTHNKHILLIMQLMVCNPFPTQPTIGSSLVVRTTP